VVELAAGLTRRPLYHRQPFRRSVVDLGSTPSTSTKEITMGKSDKSVEDIKEEMFDLEDPEELAYSLFEVVNTLEWTDD